MARLAGEPEQDLDRVMNHRHGGYEVWRLMKMLSALGDVLITVSPSGLFEKGIIYSKNIEDQGSEQPQPGG